MSRRELVIVELLERYGELVDPMVSRDGGGDGVAVPLMPRTYTRDVRELERLLVRMRSERPSQWWHVSERYLRSSRVTRDVRVRRRGKNGKSAWVIERQVVDVFSPSVRLEKVRRGVRWLADEWGLPLEPMLPRELLVAA